jgi:hypothetical protein
MTAQQRAVNGVEQQKPGVPVQQDGTLAPRVVQQSLANLGAGNTFGQVNR